MTDIARPLGTSLFIIALILFSHASGAETIKVGTYGFPVAAGNSLRSTSATEAIVHSAIYDALTEVGNDGTILPMLAIEWEAIDELTWIFKLRKGVKFSNGTPFNAASVVTVIDYLVSPASRADSIARELSGIEGAKATDDLTVEIKTKHPMLFLPARISAVRIGDSRTVAKMMAGDYIPDPIGTGPFAVTTWENDKILLTAFKDSWRAPKVENLEIYLVPERFGRLQGVRAGALHLAYNIGAEDSMALDASGHKFVVSNDFASYGLSFVTDQDHPIRDPQVRRALNYAIDKQAYIDAFFYGMTQPASQATVKGAFGYDPSLEPFPYDLDRARRLLEEAGYGNGFDLEVEALIEGTSNGAEVFQYVAAQLAQVGVRMSTRNMPVPDFIRKTVNGGFVGQAFGMSIDAKPALDSLRGITMHSCLRPVPWYCDEAVVPLIRTAETTFDRDERRTAMQAIMRRYHENPPMIYLHESVVFDGMHRSLDGYDPNVRIPNYHELYFVN